MDERRTPDRHGSRVLEIEGGEIRLGQLLKLAGLVGSGSDARPLLAAGEVHVNGEVEGRRGRRLRPGDQVEVGGTAVRLAAPPARFELGEPGPMRDRLVAAALDGTKTATTSLEVFYEIDGLPLPRPGDRSQLVGSHDEVLGTVEVVGVDRVQLAAVGDDVARAEGEGFADASAWRVAHERYWAEFLGAVRSSIGDPTWRLDDETPVVVEWFRVVPGGGDEREAPAPGRGTGTGRATPDAAPAG